MSPSSQPSITRSELYLALLTVWLFMVSIALATVPPDASWRSYALPIGTIIMFAFHANAYRQASRAHRPRTSSPTEASEGQ
jgi:hypothetical protein